MLAQKIGKEKDESWEDLLVSEKRSTLLGRIRRELWISRQSGRIGMYLLTSRFELSTDFQTEDTSLAFSMPSPAFTPCLNSPWALPGLKAMPKVQIRRPLV